MEGKKQAATGCSSFTSDLFGSNDSSGSSSSEIFNSIFAPSSKALGRESLRSVAVEKNKQDSATKPDSYSQDKEGKSQSSPKKEMSSYYHEEKIQPCHLSSSIYYGGQDIYTTPHANNQSSGYSTASKDGGEDDGRASRGNWWQGSLYY